MADLYDLGEKPPLGVVPKQMHAFAVRQSRFGQPREAWKREEDGLATAVKEIGPGPSGGHTS